MVTTTADSVAAHSKYEPVIGLEVHIRLPDGDARIFCSCSTRFGALTRNSERLPGLPQRGCPARCPCSTKKVVEFAALAAMALQCRMATRLLFLRARIISIPTCLRVIRFRSMTSRWPRARLHRNPLASNTTAESQNLRTENRERRTPKKIGITRVHLEEDAGKSLHEGFPDSDEKTAIDLNRTGVPLIEIVSEPEIASPDEAYEYLTRLKEIILYTGVSDCNMEEGSLRCDANVSVRLRGQKEFGTKAEIKNVNSFRFIREALEYEIGRQIEVLESGGKIAQETRLYNANEGKTYSMRSKEQAHDYRYFPEPDLLPLVVDETWKAEIARALPELPEARRARMVKEYGITEYDAQVLTLSKSLADQFEKKRPRLRRIQSALPIWCRVN